MILVSLFDVSLGCLALQLDSMMIVVSLLDIPLGFSALQLGSMILVQLGFPAPQLDSMILSSYHEHLEELDIDFNWMSMYE